MQPDFARTFQHTEAQTFSTKQDIGKAFHGLDIVFHVRFEKGDITSVDLDALPGREIHFHDRAIQLQEYHACTTEALHQESLTAKQTGFQLGDIG